MLKQNKDYQKHIKNESDYVWPKTLGQLAIIFIL